MAPASTGWDGGLVSVIIPTYNRQESLLRALAALGSQSLSFSRLEVIIVDDGGSDGTLDAVSQAQYPFALRCLSQANQGPTVARNEGVARSRGEWLVFMDDDIVPASGALEHLARELGSRERTVILGTLVLPPELCTLPYARFLSQGMSRDQAGGEVPFQACMTGLLAIRKADFIALGQFQDPTGGWPNWDDVDFGYRAAQEGFRFWRSPQALAEHWDYAATDLETACGRWYRAARSAPRLFRRHPALAAQIPMFRDKGPIAWRRDPLSLVARKLARRLSASRLALHGLEGSARFLEAHFPAWGLLARLYRWIGSAYIYRGYREGLRALDSPAERSR